MFFRRVISGGNSLELLRNNAEGFLPGTSGLCKNRRVLSTCEWGTTPVHYSRHFLKLLSSAEWNSIKTRYNVSMVAHNASQSQHRKFENYFWQLLEPTLHKAFLHFISGVRIRNDQCKAMTYTTNCLRSWNIPGLQRMQGCIIRDRFMPII